MENLPEKARASAAEAVLAGGGEIGALMRSHDWSATKLGAVADWPQSLRTALSICLSSRFPMLIWWGQDLIMLYNDAYRPILADKHPQSLGQPGRECWPEIWEIVGPMLEGVMIGGDATWSEDRLLLLERNGFAEECYFTFSYSPIRDETGGVGGVFTAVTETTGRVIADRRLRTLRELAARIAEESTLDSAYAIASDILSENSADIPFALLYRLDDTGTTGGLVKATGIKRDTLLTAYSINLAPLHTDLNLWQLSQVAKTPEPLPIADLNLEWVERSVDVKQALVLPIAKSAQERPYGLLVVGINPRRPFDREYRDFFDLVIGQIASAIAQIRAYEEERQRAEALAELDRQKTDFFSNVSHEFRTPIALSLGPIQDALADREDPLTPLQRDRLKIVHRNNLRLLKLVNTLLDFSRIQSDRMQAVYEPTDLGTFTAELASCFRSAVERAGIHFNVDCPPLRKPAYVDRQMWEKIVFNLLSNALKFTFEGEIQIKLFPSDPSLPACERSELSRVELQVRDTGTGIPEAELPHLFDRFYRIRGAKARSHEGSGIGLALVKELVHLHGGTIEVTSAVDRGTTFSVKIPTGTAHLPSDRIEVQLEQTSTAIGGAAYVEEALRWLPEEKPTEPISEAKQSLVYRQQSLINRQQSLINQLQSTLYHWRSQPYGNLSKNSLQYSTINPEFVSKPTQILLGNARILLVDDNSDMRDYLKRLLGQYYQVEAVADGITALEAIRTNPPDLVLTDVMMPGLDGFALLRQLRGNKCTQEIPVILLSARAGEEARIEGLQAGAEDYLIKPFSVGELLARVTATLQMARLRQESNRGILNILDSISDGFLTLDRQWRIVYLNRQSEQILQRSREELIGQNIWEEYPDIVDTIFDRQYHQAIATGITAKFEAYYPRLKVWVEVHAYPSSEGLAVYFQDITDRKQAEAALQDSEVRFRTLVENIPGAVYRCACDRDWTIHFISDAIAEICGYPASDFIQNRVRSFASILHPEDTKSIVADAIAQKQPYILEYRIIHADGSIRWVAERGQAIFNDNGHVSYLDGVIVDISQRKQIERERENLAQIVENSSDFMGIISLDGIVLSLNQAGQKMVGLNGKESVKNTQFLNCIKTEYREDFNTKIMPIVLKKGECRGEIKLRNFQTRDSLLVNYTIFRVTDKITGQTLKLATVMRDVSESRQIEKQIRFQSNILAHINEAVVAVDNDYRVTYWNKKAEEVYGFTAEATLGQKLEDVHHYRWIKPEDERESYASLATTGYWKGQNIHGTKSGRDIYVDSSVSVMKDEKGKPTGLLAVLRDITDRRQTEAALKESEQIFRELAENIHEVLWMTNPETKEFIYISPAYELVWGRSRENLYADVSAWLDSVHPDDRDRVTSAYNRKLITGECYEEYRIIRPDGSIRWIRDRSFPIINECGKIYRIVGIAEDYTVQKQAEEQLKAAVVEKEVLLQEIHHRVKNNLQIISGLLYLQSLSIQDETVLQCLTESQNRIQAIALIHEQLYASENLSEIKFENYIQVLTQNLFQSFYKNMDPINLNLKIAPVEMNPNLAIYCGLVINELVSNSLKYAFPNGRSGTIEILCESNLPNNRLELIVRDNGIGLPDDLDFRNTASLGLRLVNRLVTQQLKGEIEVMPFCGTAFKIKLNKIV